MLDFRHVDFVWLFLQLLARVTLGLRRIFDVLNSSAFICLRPHFIVSDFCRVCRCEAAPTQPLFYPCLCTGSIKYVHQDWYAFSFYIYVFTLVYFPKFPDFFSLVQWLHYSKRKTCELCGHRFTFRAVYASNMPSMVPFGVLVMGVLTALRNVVVRCVHFLAVIASWLIVVPLTVCRIYKCLFSGSIVGLLSLPMDILSTENVVLDYIQVRTGCLLPQLYALYPPNLCLTD